MPEYMNMLAILEDVNAAVCIDVAVLVLLIVFCIAGSVRGFAGECARLLAIGSGVAVTSLLYPVLRALVFSGPEIPWKILSMAGAVAAAALVGVLVHWLSRKFLRIIIGQPADSIIGAVFAMITTAITLLVILFFLHSMPHSGIHNTIFEASVSGRISEPLILYAKEKISGEEEDLSSSL